MEKYGGKKVIVFARTFLNEPVTTLRDADRPVRLLEEAATRHDLEVEFRCGRDSSVPLTAEELDGAVAVIADLEEYNAELLQKVGVVQGGDLRLIARYGIGYNNVDIDSAYACGVTVTNTPGANAPPTAEWAIATMFSVAGRRIGHHQDAASGLGKRGPGRLDVRGRTLGVIGTGTIGRFVVQFMTGFQMRVIAYDVYPNRCWAEENGVQYVSLSDVCTEADYITLHASGGKQIIGEGELKQMKSTCVLVNCARGALVDSRAAYTAVNEGRLWGYGLDEVWEYSDLPLNGVNVVVSPHVGSDTDEGKLGMQVMSAQAVIDFIEGNTPEHIVTS